MSLGEHQTSTAATRTNPPHDPEPGVPLITWIIGATALVVVLTAGAVFLDSAPAKEAGDAGAAREPAEQNEEKATDKVEPLTQKDPLELTASLIDAQERAKVWNPSAVLSGIELVIENGVPKGAVNFEFGEALGQAIPGSPLSPKRLSLSYEDKKVHEESADSPHRRVGLPEPNCPLEVAFRNLTQGGIPTGGRLGVLYTHSQKHGKPVWLVTDEQEQATSLNADSCALLRR